MTIDSSSIISNKTKIHQSVNIGPFCIIGDDVDVAHPFKEATPFIIYQLLLLLMTSHHHFNDLR